MAKKKSNAKDLRGYATTSVAPLAPPPSATPPPPPPPSTPPATPTTAKKKKKEALQQAEVAKVNNIKPLAMPPAADASATVLKLPTYSQEDDFSTYVEYEDNVLHKLHMYDPHLGEYSKFDLETAYETLFQRDGFQRQDIEAAMLVCRGNLPACYDWLSLHVPFARLPENWCFVSVNNGNRKQASSAPPQEKRQAPPPAVARSAPILMLEQQGDVELSMYGEPLKKKPLATQSAIRKKENLPTKREKEEEEDVVDAELEARHAICLDNEFAEEFGDMTEDIDYMQEEEEEEEKEPASTTGDDERPETTTGDDELDAEIAAELAKMQDLVWHDPNAPPAEALKQQTPAKKKQEEEEDDCVELSLFDEDNSTAATPGAGVSYGAPRFEGRVPPNYRGSTPKALLIAYCKKQDMPTPVFAITTKQLGKVTVRTKQGETMSFECDQICNNDTTAQELVSVIALFRLRALPNETSYLSLPPDFRAVWKQLLDDETAKALNALQEESKQRRDFVSQLLLKPLPTAAGKRRAPVTVNNKHQQHRPRQGTTSNAREIVLPMFDFKANNQAHLPIYTLKDEILDAHFSSQVVIISAETGSGKTTQVPQFLLEAYASRDNVVPKICITQPRRISATSVANRVADELGDTAQQFVGFTIRGKTTRKPTTSLLFCTSGVLLQHFSTSAASTEFDVVILDEVHERTVEGDVLMVCLKRMLKLNSKLKVVLMSATMNSSRLSEYFDDCPVLHSSGGRVFPVETLYLEDLIQRTGFTPESTGQEVTKELPQLDEDEYSYETCRAVQLIDEHCVNPLLIECALELVATQKQQSDDGSVKREETWLVFLPGLKDIFRVESQLLSHRLFGDVNQYQILLLHSTLVRDFSQFFDSSMRAARKTIILCTNIAETGITLPHVSGVIDTGRVNELKFNEKKNLTILKEEFCSKASCEQRKGRAGRIRSGVCVRLFTKHTYHTSFPAFSKPEIQRVSLSEICLKLLNHESFSPITEFFSEALDPPGEQSVVKALDRLQKLGCLIPPQHRLTALGKVLSKLPMDAALGKILVFGAMLRCTKRTCLLVALISFSSGSIFLAKKQVENLMLEMTRFVQWEQVPNKRQFVRDNALDANRLSEVQKLRNQYLAALQDEFPKVKFSDENAESTRVLSSILCAGLSVVAAASNKLVCHDNMEVRAKMGGATTSRFYTYLERMKVGAVFVSGLTPLHPAALVLFSHVPSRFTAPTCRVDLGGNGWAQLRTIAPRTCSLFSVLREQFDYTVEQCLETKTFDSGKELVDLVVDLVEHAE